MKRAAVALVLVIVCLVGCQKKEEKPAAADPPKKAPVVMYEGAIKDYLGDGYNMSWPRKYTPEFVMIHFCSAVVKHPDNPYFMGYIRQNFLLDDVSIHYVIDRGGQIFCYVPEDRVAWHAGVGTWGDDPKYTNDMNQFAIGIELVGIGSEEDMSIYLTPQQYRALDESLYGFTDEQYVSLKALVEDICQRNQIPADREHIIGHEEYSPHKNDPGQLFDWDRIIP